MIDWRTPVGQALQHRLATEQVVWLTTVAPSGYPQPRLVWFVWEGQTCLLYSLPDARKLAHLDQHPEVALHFNSDAEGSDFQVLLGRAQRDPSAPPTIAHAAYTAKYRAGILGLGMTEAEYAARFSVAVRITPVRIRGLEPLPAP